MRTGILVLLLLVVLLLSVIPFCGGEEEVVSVVMMKRPSLLQNFVTDMELLQANPHLSVPPGQSSTATIQCRNDKTAISGGCRVHTEDDVHIVVRASYPISNSKWACEWANLSETIQSQRLPRTIHVVCATTIPS